MLKLRLLAALGCAALVLMGCQADKAKESDKAPVKSFALRINAGATQDFKDVAGKIWHKDQLFKPGQWGREGGEAVTRAKVDIKDTENDAVYLSEVWGLKAYRIPVPNGQYRVQLHFAETFGRIAAAGERVFNVSIEGHPVLKDLDVFKAVGANTALVKAYRVDVIDGELTIEFQSVQNSAIINGIEVLRP